MVRINVSWFETVFIFDDSVFTTYPENRDTKILAFFCELKKKNSFLLVPLKQSHYAYVIFYENSCFWLKHVNCLDARLFDVTKIGVTFFFFFN